MPAGSINQAGHGRHEEMQVFICWSGERSYQIAEALSEWLRKIIPCRPFVSSQLEKGTHWFSQILGNRRAPPPSSCPIHWGTPMKTGSVSEGLAHHLGESHTSIASSTTRSHTRVTASPAPPGGQPRHRPRHGEDPPAHPRHILQSTPAV
jgi:hypothetical protein